MYAVPLEAVAVKVHFAADVGAVNAPLLDTVPQLAVHVTAWLAVKVCLFSACRFTAAGVIVIGEATVTAAVAALPPAVGVAVTVHEPGTRGAVYKPPLVTVPQFADHVAPALALNCCVAPSLTDAVEGDTVNPPDEDPIVSFAVAVYAVPLAAVA